jgi:hypothetical protein
MSKTTYFKIRETYCLVCSQCGTPVSKEISKSGNHYIADSARPSIHGGTFSPAHRCFPTDFQNRMIADGQIIAGQTVQVVRGRKVAKGTIGTITWVGDNGWGISYGIKLADDSVVFTAATNCEVYLSELAGA